MRVRGKSLSEFLDGQLRGLIWTIGEVRGPSEKARALAFVLVGRRRRRDTSTSFSMKALGGGRIQVRAATDDLAQAVYDYRCGLHLPPPELAGRELSQIVELGANMGGGIAALAYEHPQARLVGVEPDEGNYAIACRNVEQFGDRVQLVQRAIWESEAELSVLGDKTNGYTVRERRPDDPAEVPAVRATTVDAILAERMPTGPIDYMTITIEGSEPRLLAAGGEWTERLGAIRVECHPRLGFTTEEGVQLLERLGFRAQVAPDDRGASWKFVTGVRS